MSDRPLLYKGLLPILALLLLADSTLMAQPVGSESGPRSNQVNSPYSHYGIGNLNAPYGANDRGMGGAATATTPAISINDFNPASYSFLNAATLDAAFEANRRSVFLGGQTTSSGTGNFSYFNLGMSAGKHFGLNIGFRPIANMYYNANDTPNIQGLGSTIKNFNGSGNLQYGFIGLSGQYKGLSIGANFGYAFGNYSYSTTLQTSGGDSTGTLNHNRSAQKTRNDIIGGIYWKGGLLYQKKVGKGNHINIGLTTTLSQDLKVKRQNYALAYNYISDGSTTEMIIDTIEDARQKGKLTLPASYSFGLAYGNTNRWEVATDFTYTDWSVFNKMGNRDGVGDNAWRASLGGFFTPNTSVANKKYLSFVTYRIGAYYGKDYFNTVFNTDVNYFGGTIGASFPLQRNYNNYGKINLSLDIGQRGSTQDGQAKEVYVNFTFGISLNDAYWLKRPARYQ